MMMMMLMVMTIDRRRSYLGSDESQVRHGGRMNQVSVDNKADFYRIWGEGHYIGKGTH